MQFRKLKLNQIEKDVIYVAYSAKNKLLSANGDAGVFVKLQEKTATGLKVEIVGTDKVTAIAKLDTREDAWVYDPSGADIPVQVQCHDVNEWPGFTKRMQDQGLNGTVFAFDPSELITNQREGVGQGVMLVRHKGGSKHPATGEEIFDNYRVNWLKPVETPVWRIPRAQRMGLGAVELPLPPKPMPPEAQGVVDNLMKAFKAISGKLSENVSFAQVTEDFEGMSVHTNRPCHANLQHGIGIDAPRYIVTTGFNDTGRWKKGRPDDEALRLYITYLVSYSPYKDVFITKDVDFILKHGYAIDCTQPNRLVAGACFATRQAWEKPWRASGFYELYKAGVPLDAAFLFGCQCSLYQGGKIKFSQGGVDHTHIQNDRMSDRCMVNFIKHSPANPGKPYIEDVHASSGTGVDGMWSGNFGSQSQIYKSLSNIKRAGGSWDDSALPVDEAVELAADLIDEWLGKHGLTE